MNSRWKMYKIGLVDFWYYDEQEFYFLDGRMLLRGANGSGKSVTMQSFIPLLLDGNMRPERLDPFGSRARKMENYLLEEGDGRSERTGYLYMEFKRKEANQYITIGIGMRARKGKKLDAWYFCLTDGRRIGKDFFLYKDLNQKIVYTKTELKNRIGEGGKVFDSQKSYAQYVNQMLFGFDTMEEYKEMLELLIQLRTPKLSKDFKPTIINDILGNSLQTLSEDDLRPMSEAIENMDELKTNLDNVRESLEAGRRIEKIYNQYNESVLYNKALSYREGWKIFQKYENEIGEIQKQIQWTVNAYEEEIRHHEALLQEQKMREQERNSLKDSDATKLKEKELKLEEEIQELGHTVREKEKQYQGKEERRIELEDQKRTYENEKTHSWQQVQENLEEMEEYINEVSCDEFDCMKNDLKNRPEEKYDFSVHRQLLLKYMDKVKAGNQILENERHIQLQYDNEWKKMDECRKEREQAEREYRQYQIQLGEIKDEWIESIYQWERKNEQLKVNREILQEITRRIHAYVYGNDEYEILDPIRKKRYQLEEKLRQEQRILSIEIEEKQKELHEKKKELEEWKNKKEPEPERKEAVIRNRELLKEQKIPYLEFYKTVDFTEALEEEQRNRLEEALLRMGVLDALIVDCEYREKIFALNQGTCDTYIFSDVASVKGNLGMLLEISNEENDILFYQKVSKVLSGLGYDNQEKDCLSWIDLWGNYKSGILEGTITGEYQAKFIGARTREIYRDKQIVLLEEVCSQLSQKIDNLQEKLHTIQNGIGDLIDEWKKIPDFDDLKVAAREFEYRENLLEKKIYQVQEQQDIVKKRREELDEIRMQVQKICAEAYLTARLDVFLQARDDLSEYQNLLSQLQLNQQSFLAKIHDIHTTEGYIEEILQDMDDILYDQNKAVSRQKGLLLEQKMIQEQLKLTDYEALKEKLDECIKRLASLPKEIELSIEKKTSLSKDQEMYRGKLEELQIQYLKQQDKVIKLEEVFREENQLDYVSKEYVQTKDMLDQAYKICKEFGGKFAKKSQDDISGNMREAFHANQIYLRDYNLSIETLFEMWEEQEKELNLRIRRIDIVGKYRGITISFLNLLQKLENDVEEKTRLLNDKDREIFEDILANTISKKIRSKIQSSKRWVDEMNRLMDSMQTSSGLRLSLKWKNKRAETEEQMDTRMLVQMLEKDVEIMREEEVDQLSAHFRSKINEARKRLDDSNNIQSFHSIMKEVLDYRKWFEFQLECQKAGEKKKELTDHMFFTFSGGEKAMAMYVPLFSAVVAKYSSARKEAPRMISLDEAFAGVDEMNIKDMFRLMVEFEFDFIINSQILWGDYETVPAIAIYQLLRPENVKYVTVISYVWNGHVRTMEEKIGDSFE